MRGFEAKGTSSRRLPNAVACREHLSLGRLLDLLRTTRFSQRFLAASRSPFCVLAPRLGSASIPPNGTEERSSFQGSTREDTQRGQLAPAVCATTVVSFSSSLAVRVFRLRAISATKLLQPSTRRSAAASTRAKTARADARHSSAFDAFRPALVGLLALISVGPPEIRWRSTVTAIDLVPVATKCGRIIASPEKSCRQFASDSNNVDAARLPARIGYCGL